MILPALIFSANDFRYMSWYRTYPSPDSKLFVAMGVRRFANAPLNHFKAIFSLIFLWQHHFQRMLQSSPNRYTPTIQTLDNLMRFSTNFKSMLFLPKQVSSGINHPLPILTKSLSYVFPSIFKLPLNHTWLHFQTLSLTSNSNLHDLFVNLCQFPSHIHYPPTHSLPILLFMSLLFAIYRNLNSELLP